MKYITLPTLNEKVSCLALGVNKTGKRGANPDTVKERISLCHKALDLGINLFDTAELYGAGHSEEILGHALADRRDQALVCTKFNAENSTKKRLQVSLENSLRRLRTDYIDFYLAHWPNPAVDFEELLSSLHKFKDEGKIRAFGLSNATAAEIRNITNKNNNDFLIVENEYNLVIRDVEADIFPMSKENQHLFLAYSPLLEGRNKIFSVSTSERVEYLRNKYQCSPSQLFLAWLSKKQLVSIVRTGSEIHLKENVAATSIDISKKDLKMLEHCYKIKKKKIPFDKIKLDNRSYMSAKEALKNDNDLIPSPKILSERIEAGYPLPPLRVVKHGDKYKIVDQYYVNEIKKLWAWKIANEKENNIEAYIFNDL